MLAPTHTAANAMTRQMPDPAAALASGRRRAGAGGRAGRPDRPSGGGRDGWDVGGERGQLGAGPRGQRPARPLVELVPGQPPCTNASFSASITCSRSAWPARSRSPPAAAGSCGPVVTGTSPYAT